MSTQLMGDGLGEARRHAVGPEQSRMEEKMGEVGAVCIKQRRDDRGKGCVVLFVDVAEVDSAIKGRNGYCGPGCAEDAGRRSAGWLAVCTALG